MISRSFANPVGLLRKRIGVTLLRPAAMFFRPRVITTASEERCKNGAKAYIPKIGD